MLILPFLGTQTHVHPQTNTHTQTQTHFKINRSPILWPRITCKVDSCKYVYILLKCINAYGVISYYYFEMRNNFSRLCASRILNNFLIVINGNDIKLVKYVMKLNNFIALTVKLPIGNWSYFPKSIFYNQRKSVILQLLMTWLVASLTCTVVKQYFYSIEGGKIIWLLFNSVFLHWTDSIVFIWWVSLVSEVMFCAGLIYRYMANISLWNLGIVTFFFSHSHSFSVPSVG